MEYRELNFINDIDEVVKLINENLDPLYTKEIILWKHLHNPFGKSIAMVAIDKNKIVGVVFYMRYNFLNSQGELSKSIRPLDVCTNKNQRGKGVFKILLKKCLEEVNDYDILISTPNQQSFPEFLKLGWAELKDEYYFNVGLIFPTIFGKGLTLLTLDHNINPIVPVNSHRLLVTANSLDFIRWRYEHKDYTKKCFFKNGYLNVIIYRIEKLKGFKTIVLCDFMGDESLLNEAVKSVSRLENIFIFYYLNNSVTKNIRFTFNKVQQKALIIYKLNNVDFKDYVSFSLGDIEARL